MQKGKSGHVNKVVKVMLALLLSFTLLPQHLAVTAEAQDTTEETRVYLILDDGVEVDITDGLEGTTFSDRYQVDTEFHENPRIKVTGEDIARVTIRKLGIPNVTVTTKENNSSDKTTFTFELFDLSKEDCYGNGGYSIIVGAKDNVSGYINFTGYSPITEPEVDKSALQELFDEVSVYEPTTTDTTYLAKLTEELSDAETVLDDPDATEDDVYYATNGLKAAYLLAQISGYNQTYRPMELGGKVTDYSQYTPESALQYYRAFKKAQYISPNMGAPSHLAYLEEMRAAYEAALNTPLVEPGALR